MDKIGTFSGEKWERLARRLLSQDGRIEFANLQIGFQLAYYRVRLFRLKAGGKGINVDTGRKTGGLLQRPVSHCLRCCSLPSNLSLLYLSTPGNLSPFSISVPPLLSVIVGRVCSRFERRNSPLPRRGLIPSLRRISSFFLFFFFFSFALQSNNTPRFFSLLPLIIPSYGIPLGREIFEMEEP